MTARGRLRRIALLLEYDGTDFVGWQAQANGRSVQAVIESTVKACFHENRRVIGSGRTDSGVHATGQVAHLDLAHPIAPERVRDALNSRLPADVQVRASAEAGMDFHARRDAKRRRYLYRLADGGAKPVIDRRTVAFTPFRLDEEAMHRAAQSWLGKHDYSSFRAALCQAESPIRSIDSFTVLRGADRRIEFTIEARAFLHHQVRIMVGTLFEIGRGERPVEWADEVLAAKDRSQAGQTFPSCGLTFVRVDYARRLFPSSSEMP